MRKILPIILSLILPILAVSMLIYSCNNHAKNKSYIDEEQGNSILFYQKLLVKETFMDSGVKYNKGDIYFLNWIDTLGATIPYWISKNGDPENTYNLHSTNKKRFTILTQYKRLP